MLVMLFVAKLRLGGIGEDAGDDRWAAWDEMPSDILSLPVKKV